MARTSGISTSSVQRIWRAFGLQPHRAETFKLSTDPLFVDKVRDIVGLYMSPPSLRGSRPTLALSSAPPSDPCSGASTGLRFYYHNLLRLLHSEPCPLTARCRKLSGPPTWVPEPVSASKSVLKTMSH
jgi:hypothetical protein